MTHFITDEHGDRTFTHEAWEVRIWSEGTPGARVWVSSPDPDHEVSVDADGFYVNGSHRGAWADEPAAFTIPWPVIEAIIAARRIVGQDQP